MDRGVEMIRKSPKPVLVNCFAGINRSASLVAAYLMAECGMSFQRARDYLVKANEKRSVAVLTNRDFVKALTHYREYLQMKKKSLHSR
jgi:protein-tyrosine phosphatase